MGGIEVCIPALTFPQASHAGASRQVKGHLQLIVDIAAFHMDDIAEKPLPHHIEDQQLEKIIAAVFQHHAMSLCSFGGFSVPDRLDPGIYRKAP